MNRDILQQILDIGITLSKEKDREQLLDQMLMTAMDLTRCDGGTLYINNGEELEFKIMITKSQGIHQGGARGKTTLPPVPLRKENVCACAVLYRGLINIANVYDSQEYDFSGAKRYDAMTGYHTQSMLVVPLEDDQKNIIGVVQLINALDENGTIIPFRKEYERILSSIGSQAAICLVNMSYVQRIQEMLDSYVKVMSSAIDARTPYNANHTRNMVIYATRFIEWLRTKKDPESFDEKKEQQFLMSIWLHDIGKLITPLEIMDKQDRLADNYYKIKERLAKIRLLTRIEGLRGEKSEQETQVCLEQIKKAEELVDYLRGNTFLTDEKAQEVEEISRRTYREEDGTMKPWVTPEEKEQLLIRKGTLTAKERSIMQKHVEMTQMMLEKMELGEDYKDVKKWAAQHHELLNGKGYPKGLKQDEICREVRLLTILDIFEAMTAVDRPYKPPMPAERAFEIMHQMADNGEIDADILHLYEQSHAWEAPEKKREE